MGDRRSKADWLEEGCIEDFEYFKRCVERGTDKLVGSRTKENVRNCFHCKHWRKADKFIKEIEEILDIRNIKKTRGKK